MIPKKKPFHGLGIILESIIAGTQVAVLGSATAIQQDKVRKSQHKASSILDLLHRQRLADIKTEGEKLEESIRIKAETALTEEKGIRTAAYMGVTTAILASFVLLYFLLRGKRDEE
jgi:UDP-N-acetylglucosamine enolpyruvyl transferase